MIHSYFKIPGWFGFHDVYDRAVALAPDKARFCEVGCWQGRSTAYLAVNIINSGKDITLDCVDTWEGLPGEGMPKVDHLIDVFWENMRPMVAAGLNLNVHQGDSVEVAKEFKNETFDFIFLDAAHDDKSVAADVSAWRPKLKPGGTLAGDDLTWEEGMVMKGLLDQGIGRKENPIVLSAGPYVSWIATSNVDAWGHPGPFHMLSKLTANRGK